MAGFYVGHGRHWDFMRGAGYSDSALMALFYQTYLASQANVVFESGDVRLVCEPHQELAIGQLMQGTQLSSAFPYVNGGHTWPIEIKDRYEWPTPIEAQLIGSCHGAKVGWFDPQYARNSAQYRDAQGPLAFQINALAYSVWRTQFQNREQEEMMGKMKAYLPLADEGDFVASGDEIQFVSHVEEARSLEFHRVPIDVYTLTIALPDDFPMRLNLYTPQAAARDQFAVGDRISGVCWLFGALASAGTH